MPIAEVTSATIEPRQAGTSLLWTHYGDAFQHTAQRDSLLLVLNLPAFNVTAQQGLAGNPPRLALLPLLTETQRQGAVVLQ